MSNVNINKSEVNKSEIKVYYFDHNELINGTFITENFNAEKLEIPREDWPKLGEKTANIIIT